MSKPNENIFAHHKRRRTSRRRRRSILFASVIVLLGLVAISRWFAGVAREVDLVANVSYYTAPFALLLLLLALVRRRWIASICLLAISLVAGWPILHSIIADYSTSARSSRYVTPNSTTTISVLVVNADGNAEALERLLSIFDRDQPDLVAIVEAGQEAGRAFLERGAVMSMYPYRVEPDRSIYYSVALLSRHPMTRLSFADDASTVDEETYAWHHSYLVDLPNGAEIIFTAAHPASPRTREAWRRGNDKVEALANLVRKQINDLQHPVILAGDFNTTATGYRYRLMRSRSGLVSSDDEVGGLLGTWPAQLPAFLRLSLDRLWISPAATGESAGADIRLISRNVLENIGSDHRPVMFRMVVKPE